MSGASGGGLQEDGGEFLLAEQDSGAHSGMAELGDTPAAGAGESGDQATQVEAFDEPRDLRAPRGIGRDKQLRAHVAVAKAMEGVFTTEDRSEGARSVVAAGLKARDERPWESAPAARAGRGARWAGGIVDDGERLAVAVIGCCGHGGVPRQERHALRQEVLPESAPPAAPGRRRTLSSYGWLITVSRAARGGGATSDMVRL
jgi:hypothetical protein